MSFKTFEFFYVESCGVIVEATKKKLEAYAAFNESGGAKVQLLGRDYKGDLHILQEKINGCKGDGKILDRRTNRV